MVRGVDSDSIVSSLVDKGLVAERGTLDAPGRPVLFGTTDAFLRCFGLESIDDLPKTELQMSGEQVAIDFTAEEPAENTKAE
jgi:segregation and condensation protein B